MPNLATRGAAITMATSTRYALMNSYDIAILSAEQENLNIRPETEQSVGENNQGFNRQWKRITVIDTIGISTWYESSASKKACMSNLAPTETPADYLVKVNDGHKW